MTLDVDRLIERMREIENDKYCADPLAADEEYAALERKLAAIRAMSAAEQKDASL